MATTNAPEGWLEDYAAAGFGKNESIGVLLIHGFTGSPASMRDWAHYLNERGYTVRVPRMPGHGTKWDDLGKVKWQEWPAKTQAELDELRKSCSKVFVFGLSVGGCITLNTAERNEVDGIVLVNPMIHVTGPNKYLALIAPIVMRFVKGLPSVGDDIKKPGVTEWGYDMLSTAGGHQLGKMLKATRSNLKKVVAPTLLFHSVEDHVLPVSNSDLIMAEISSTDKQRIELTNSFHVATMDYDADLIFVNSLEFLKLHS